MNPINWVKMGVIFVIAFLIGSLAMMTNLYLGKRDELVELRGQVEVLAEQAKIEAEVDRLMQDRYIKTEVNDEKGRWVEANAQDLE